MMRSIRILLPAVLMLFSGCALQPTPATKPPKADPTLPTVSKVKTLSDMTEVALEWTPIYDERAKGYHIYRALEGKTPKRIHTVKDRYSSHYLDRKLKPNTKYVYQITVFRDGSESYPSAPVVAKTLPVPDPVPFVSAIDHLPREVKIIWRPHPYLKVDGYLIERSRPEDREWKEIATLKGRLNAEYIDRGLEDNKTYYYRIIATTCDGVRSLPSKVVEANTKPRPAIVQGLEATKNLPKKIVVKWLPNKEPDIVYYKVYRSIFEIGPYLSIAKTKRTEYVDPINKDGVKRYYKVTAVDKDELESFKQDVPAVGTTLGLPLPPKIVEKSFDGKVVRFRWTSPDNRAVSYIVKKKEILSFFTRNEYTFKDIRSTTFSDDALKPDAKYIYTVYAVDRNGLVSEPSEEIVVKTGE
ncbi:MAG: fibronectin type III domain-containing protein [Epsilonproteobacteria bacterium]|nr:fibronectin type III domain-containing protein [Campylobacterota bacterium]